MHTYVNKIIKELQTKAQLHQFDTIYVGGGTPNSLDDDLLILLLRTLGKYLSKHYEFTIECNPEHLTLTQAHLLNANKVNRVSIGMQTTNNTLLTKFRRHHTLNDVKNAVSNLRKVGIENISIDLIYGFNELTNADLHNTIKFIKTMQIPHIS
jgi:oxygen-independent coproporphyrinogen-3 oxidase